MNQELSSKIEQCRADYEQETGRSCKHFFCPILLRDEETELCEGHIVNESLSGRIWVPQRRDIDNFFGSTVEADLVTIVEDRNKDPHTIMHDPKLRRKHKPQMTFGGEACGYYFPGKDAKPVPGHTLFSVTSENREICKMVIKVSEERVLSEENSKLEFTIEKNYCPSIIAAVMKAAHLTMFRMLGYKYVLSFDGTWLADILKQFFNQHGGNHCVSVGEIEGYFAKYETMVAPIYLNDPKYLKGTVNDNRLVACVSAHDEIFAYGVIVKAGAVSFCVFLPTGVGKTIDTYFDFLNQPPTSIATRLMWFCPASQTECAHWKITQGDLLRIPLNQPAPPDF